MDDQRLGAAIRAVRIRRRLRQLDLAEIGRVSRATVSLLERGHCETLSLIAIRRIAAAVDVRVDLVGRWRGGDLDRLLNRRQSVLAESFAAAVALAGGWEIDPEVSFAIYGERGVIDQLAWHAETGHLLVVEFKTQFVDVNELLGTLDRKRRLIRQIAGGRGWTPSRISTWLVISDTSTNRRHAREHATLLRSRLPLDGRQLRALLRNPACDGSGVAFWSDSSGSSTGSGIRTVPRPRTRAGASSWVTASVAPTVLGPNR